MLLVLIDTATRYVRPSREQTRRRVLRELDLQLQRRATPAIAVTSEAKAIEHLTAAAAYRQQGCAAWFTKAGAARGSLGTG